MRRGEIEIDILKNKRFDKFNDSFGYSKDGHLENFEKLSQMCGL